MVSIKAHVATLVIYENENRDVATSNIVSAYLKVDMDDFLAMKIEGIMVEYGQGRPLKILQARMDIQQKEGDDVRIVNELYGYIRSGLLWYNLFSETLEKIGFVLNLYDLCASNKTINGKQCTITWYVNNLKVSHMEPSVIDNVIQALASYF